MACENCGFVTTPGQAAQGGSCPNCERPYRMQPTPLNSEMEMRDMPAPGEEDTGGNPLQEGVLGDYQNRGVRDEAFSKVATGDEEGYEGWPNWDSWHTKLLLDNEREPYEAMQEMAKRNAHPDEIKDYATHAVIGPHNKQQMADAKEWNTIPEEERIDHSYEDMKDKSPKAADIVEGLGFGPDVSDYQPQLMDPEKVDWDRIKHHTMQALNEEYPNHPAYQQYQAEQQKPAYPPAPTNPNTSLDEPGNTFLPSNWTASANAPDFEVTDVLVPDPESIRSDKEQMEKKADFLNDALQVAAPVAGGLVGSIVPGVGTAIGAGIGAGLAGGGMEALQGGDLGQSLETGVTDGALGGIGGGLAGGAMNALGTGTGTALEGSLAGVAGTAGADTMENAAASGASKGGIGSLMRSAWGKVPTQKIQQAYMMHSLMGDAGNQLGQATTPAQNMLPQGTPNQSIYSAVETPTSQDHIPSNDTSDPEEVDFHENEEDKPGLKDPSVNDIGGTDLGPDDFFPAESGALSSFAELLPKVLEFALSDKSAAGDPDMEDLHQKLEAESPGYMNNVNDDHGEKLVVMMLKGGPQGEEDGDESLQDNDTPHDPISEHEATAIPPGLGNICPNCGGTIDPSSGHCPQCGAGNMMHQPMSTNPDLTNPQEMQALAAATQGPNTDQQKAAVAELLQQEGRGEEVPTMLMEPWNYADELAKITTQEEPPESIGQEGPPPPVPPQQPGEMPVPGMSAPPGGGGGAGGPQMMSAVKKYAASVDGFCEHCPNCGGHSTGYIDYEEGKAGCKTCGHQWDAPKMVKSESHVAAGEDMHAAPITPEVSMVQPEQEQEQSSSLSWTDEEGSPLKVGQAYDMYSSNYDIPDRITVTAVKPDVIEYTINGEYGLSHQSELTHEEASVDGERFVPAQIERGEPTFEENQGAQPMDPPPGQQTDLSTPHEMMASTHTADVDPMIRMGFDHLAQRHAGQQLAGCPMCENPRISQVEWNAMVDRATGVNHNQPQQQYNESQRTADFDDTQMPGLDSAGGQPPMPPGMDNNVTQQDAGQANRLAQMLMKEGFPQAMAEAKAVELERGLGRHEMGGVAEDMAEMPTVPHPMGPTASTKPEPKKVRRSTPEDPVYRMGSAPPMSKDSHEIALGENNSAAAQDFFDEHPTYQGDAPAPAGLHGPDWLMEGGRTAGAHMSPWEQKGYIDESGDARNADKLQLDGTHYEMDDLLNDSFLFGL